MTNEPMAPREGNELVALARRLHGHRGRRYWRSLEELADSPQFHDYLQREFPGQAASLLGDVSRRRFLQLMAASLALAGLNGCRRQPAESIVPYVRQPEPLVPGEPRYYATAMPHDGAAMGLLVESHMARPTKVEGNPQHPASPATGASNSSGQGDSTAATGGGRVSEFGASNTFAQAAVLALYDPDRSQAIRRGRRISTWDAFLTDLQPRLQGRDGRGLRILTETVTSPTLAAQLQALTEKHPRAKWVPFDPVNHSHAREGARLAFGRPLQAIYDFRRADIVLSLDDDFLTSGSGALRHARQFTERRRVAAADVNRPEMNRLYAVETTPTPTGMKADHRLALDPTAVVQLAIAVAARLGMNVPEPSDSSAGALDGVPPSWLDALVDDLQNYRLSGGEGGALVVAGRWQPPIVHALAHAINEQLGSVGVTVRYTQAAEAQPVDQFAALAQLVEEMRDGDVEMLVMLGGNPVFNAPADLKFTEALEKVPCRVHLSSEYDETSNRCHWHLPRAHLFESWSDARAEDGTVSIIQPLIEPLYDGRGDHEAVASLLGEANKTSKEIVEAHWRNQHQGDEFNAWWRRTLHDGVMTESARPAENTELDFGAIREALDSWRSSHDGAGDDASMQIVFRPDPTIWDGRFANNGWLQELPKPLSKLTWDNAALLSPNTAERLGLENEQVVLVRHADAEVELPAWILPGQPDNVVTVHLGYGRTHAGRIATGAGSNVYPLRTSQSPWFAAGVEVRKTPKRRALACTQHHHLMEGRRLVVGGTLEQLRASPSHPEFMEVLHGEPEESFYPPHEYDGYKWGMAIDLSACVGCNGCVVACQAENNIPVVGKEEVARGREMHWIRVDQYFSGERDNPTAEFQPLPCMHCELAPCEPVCPVAATSHSSEGLNEMTYNRCVGTRYCANNCPYKVRRFNYLDYSSDIQQHPSLHLLQNPDVTVRSRGVMEKCTYCVQRISAARIAAEKQDRSIRDGEVVTACQAACPTRAIEFGDLNDPNSRVTRLKGEHNPLDYALLGELNTRPRTTYSAALRNPNPKL
ncbi:MAG: TAT-variant-translocated molybdopterin oxidoreductase [Pirellulaceae bacterium]